MKEKIKTFLCVLILIGALPYIITVVFQGDNQEIIQPEELTNQESNNKHQEVENINIEEYLVGMVARQMPISYETEALKAQAVIARTNLLASIEYQEELPESLSKEELIKLWEGENYAENYQRLLGAIGDTEGMVMRCQGKYIYAAFHAVSAGATRNGATVLGSEETPWLQSVDGKSDIPSKDYLKVCFLEKKQFVETVQTAFPEIILDENNPLGTIGIEGRDEGDYVTQVKIGETSISGEDFRNGIGLNSACFYLKEVEGKIRIVTKGLGHGLGMSQYGANELAKGGADYLEILGYYFKNIEISD